MTVTTAQVTTLLENVLFESATVAAANATTITATANINPATSTVAGLSAFLATQPEAGIAEQVVRYYQGAFGRVPSPSEISFYVNIAEQGLSANQIALGTSAVSGSTWAQIATYFAASPEYQKDFGLTGTTIPASSEAAVITAYYNNILGRAPSSAEISFYENALAAGTASASSLLQFFTTSPEYQAHANATIEQNLAAAGVAAAAVPTGTDPLASTTPIGSLPAQTGSNASLTFNSSTATYVAGVTVAGATGSASNSLTLNDGGLVTATPVNLSLPAGATVTNIQTLNVNGAGTDALVLDASGSAWSALTTLNFTSGGAQTITVGSGVAVTSIDKLVDTTATTIDGGSNVTITATGSIATSGDTLGAITIGGNTAPTGNVTVTATETGATTGTLGSITVTGGVNVAVTSTEVFATSSANPGTITVSGATGTVTVTSNTTVAEAAGGGNNINAAAINVTGGTTVSVTETVSATKAALGAANADHVTEGAVTVLDGGTATTVTINQTTAVGSAFVAGTLASSTAAVAGTPGVSGTAATNTAAVAATPAVLAVVAGTVEVAGAAAGITLADASATITSVTLGGYGTNSFINSTALTTATLSGIGNGLTIYNNATTPSTTVALDLNGLTDATGLTTSGFTTLNVVTGGTSGSTLAQLTDAAATTLNVSGTQTLALTSDTGVAGLTKIVVSGAAGFSGSLASLTASGTGLSFTTTSSGTITTTLHANGLDTFSGSTGTDVITLTADQTKAVAAGTATNNELILTGVSGTYLTGANHTWSEVTGFNTLGISSAANDGTYDFSTLGTNTFKTIDVISGTGTKAIFTNVATGGTLKLDATDTTAAAFVYQTADATGPSDAVGLSLGTTKAPGVVTIGNGADTGTTAALSSLVMEDANQVGIGTLNVVSNGTAANVSAHAVNTLVALADSGLSTLNVSGTVGLTITTLNEGVTAGTSATAASSFAIDNTSGGHVTVTTFTDSALGSLTFSGTGGSSVGTLTGVSGHVLTLANTGTGSAGVGIFSADTSLTTLTLTGNVALGTDGALVANPNAQGGAAGITVAGSTDNAHVNFTAAGAGAGATDTITLGNGNDLVTDSSTAGTVKVTVGTGSNFIDLHLGSASTYSASVTLGAHTGVDVVDVGVVAAAATAPNTVITGALTGDQVGIANLTSANYAALSSGNQTTVTGEASLAAAVAFVDTGLAVGHSTSFTYGGNTYVLEHISTAGGAGAGPLVAGDTLVELVGTHTFTAANGVLTLAS